MIIKMPEIGRRVREIFQNVQANKTCHQRYEKKLRKLYEKVDSNIFSEAFIGALVIPLTRGERSLYVDNSLIFAAKFAVNLYTLEADLTDDEQMGPFLRFLFDFVLTHHNAKDQSARYRICYFLNLLLNLMGEEASLVDELCDRVTATMTERLMDKSPKVRVQAVLALQRLQDPMDDKCKVIAMYIFHLTKDPNSEVRKAVLSCMAKNKKTLQAVLKRTRDINDHVRKMAYEFVSKITVRSLSIKQREELLNSGLNDKSPIVKRAVAEILLPSWLQHFEGKYTTLLRALDAEIATDTAVLALNALFKHAELDKLMKQLPVDSETKLIPMAQLSSEVVLYWRCLVEHLHRESCTDEIDQCLSELSKFCAYIDKFMKIMVTEENENGDLSEQQFILYQLFEIAKSYDLADEIGRSNLSKVILDAIMAKTCTEKLINSVVQYLERVVPNVDARLESLAHAISEIRMPIQQTEVVAPVTYEDQQRMKFEIAKLKVKLNEIQEEEYEAIQRRDFLKAQELKEQIEKMREELEEMVVPNVPAVLEEDIEEKSDRDTMVNCLSIMYNMIHVKSVTALTPTIRSLFRNLVLPGLEHDDTLVYILTLKALGVCCLLDEAMAKENIMLYLFQFSITEQAIEIWVESLRAIFDLLLHYGFETLDITQNENETVDRTEDRTQERTRDRTQDRTEDTTEDRNNENSTLQLTENSHGNSKLIKIIIGLLDNREEKLRTVAAEGLCKLLLHGRISGSHLLSRLIILLHNPINADDAYMRSCLCSFFEMYIKRVSDSQEMLEQAFLPTLQTLANAPDSSPLQGIKPLYVATFIIGLTSSHNHKPGSESFEVHNNLALAILAEVLDNTSEIDRETLLKALTYLVIRFEDDGLKKNAQEAADKIIDSLDESENRLVKCVELFKRKFIENAEEEPPINMEESEQEEEE